VHTAQDERELSCQMSKPRNWILDVNSSLDVVY